MMAKALIGIAVGVYGLLTAGVVNAQQTACGDRAQMVGQLAEKYGEHPMQMGVTAGGRLIELLTTDDGSTWTMLLTMPDGRSCMVATGERWERAPQKPAGREI